MKIIRQFLVVGALLLTMSLQAQLLLVTGETIDQTTGQPIPNMLVSTPLADTYSDENGYFELELAADVDEISFTFSKEGYNTTTQLVNITGNDVVKLGKVNISNATDKPTNTPANGVLDSDIPIVTIAVGELEAGSQSENISGLLTASRDPFINAAAFTFGPLRFRIRGLDSENTTLFMNGVPVNELENGRLYWSQWGGLNDVFRNRQNVVGLGATDFGFGGMGGANNIDTRASNQRKQTRISYARSNRSYFNRIMGTYSTGMMENGWAISLSGSRRWAEEGYIEGTFYDSWSYFASIDRKLGDSQTLNLTVFGSPTKRGRSGAVTDEVYQLAGNNFYNPHWGWQEGRKRNGRIANVHQPMTILRHDWSISEKTNLMTSVSYQFGRNGNSRLDWFDAPDPRPDYYRYLPSFFALTDSTQAAAVTQSFKDNPDLLQLNWNGMYQANYNNNSTIENTNGDGGTISGRFAQYIEEELRFDSKEFNFNTNLTHELNEEVTINGGLTYQAYEGENYRMVKDLLGADFRIDWDQFAVRDLPGQLEARDSDIRTPNRVIGVGDRFGFDYTSHINKASAWAQAQINLKKVDFHISGQFSNTTFWRTGNMQNGRFPNNSLGESEKQSFNNYAVKGGATYKINNKNYLFANAAAMTRAPFFRVAYVSPRTRDQLVPNLQSEQILGIEGGYVLNGPEMKIRATGYFYDMNDGTNIIRFYSDFQRAFGSYVLTNIDKQHRGLELAVQRKINAAWSATAVAALGEYKFDSRQTANIYLDNDSAINIPSEDVTIYSNGFFVSGTPQTAYTLGINYNSPKFWFATLNFNYLDDRYLGFSPERRRSDAVYDLDNNENPDILDQIVNQAEVPAAFTVDVFAGKSWRFGDRFLYLNLGINNLLNNTTNITGGFEQLRLDLDELFTSGTDTFEPRIYYGYGMNFFANVTLRF